MGDSKKFLRMIVNVSTASSKNHVGKLIFVEWSLGSCDTFVKRKISVINEMKRDEILLKLKVRD